MYIHTRLPHSPVQSNSRVAPPLIIDIQYITARIPRLTRAGPPIPPMIVLKHGELR